jgi:hypothetical protein
MSTKQTEPKDTNGTRAVSEYLLKIIAGLAVMLIGGGVLWLVSTTHTTQIDVHDIKLTINANANSLTEIKSATDSNTKLLNNHSLMLATIPTEFPPGEYRKDVDRRFDDVMKALAVNKSLMVSNSVIKSP